MRIAHYVVRSNFNMTLKKQLPCGFTSTFFYGLAEGRLGHEVESINGLATRGYANRTPFRLLSIHLSVDLPYFCSAYRRTGTHHRREKP